MKESGQGRCARCFSHQGGTVWRGKIDYASEIQGIQVHQGRKARYRDWLLFMMVESCKGSYHVAPGRNQRARYGEVIPARERLGGQVILGYKASSKIA